MEFSGEDGLDVFGLGGGDDGEVEEPETTICIAPYASEASSDYIFEKVEPWELLVMEYREMLQDRSSLRKIAVGRLDGNSNIPFIPFKKMPYFSMPPGK